MEKLSPIPIPPSQKWRHFRLTKVPALVFALTLVAVVIAWHFKINPGAFQGEVMLVKANVSSPGDGSLAKLMVEPFDQITAGQPIAEIHPAFPEVMEASLDIIRAEIELAMIEAEQGLEEAQTVYRFEQLQLDWLRQKADLVDAQARLTQAKNNVRRNQELSDFGVVSTNALELAEAEWLSLQNRVQEQEELMQSVRSNLDRYRPSAMDTSNTNTNSVLLANIELQKKNLALLETQMQPIVLKAPISGQINQIFYQRGETIMAGDPILTIHSSESPHILSFIPQPISFEPQVGMPVEVRTRSVASKQMAMGKVLGVGNQIQSNTNRFLSYNLSMPNTGIPILISRPAELKARPGEIVDLNFIY